MDVCIHNLSCLNLVMYCFSFEDTIFCRSTSNGFFYFINFVYFGSLHAYNHDPYAEVKLFNLILTVCVALFGLVSNTVVILVNRKIKNLKSTDVYITLLAVTDNMLIVSVGLFSLR